MRKRLLFVFAHPDDESFACAGTMAKYHEQGHEVSLICATSGCKGKSGEFQLTCREKLAKLREEELCCAADALGISHLFLYRYPDGTLIEQDSNGIAQRIEANIRELNPDVVVTFPPDGVTGHSDHIAICRATGKAVVLAEEKADMRSDFYFVSIPHYYDYCADAGPKAIYPITSKVDITSWLNKKGEALSAHRSQVYSLNRAYPGVINGDYSAIGKYEYFTLTRSQGNHIEPIEALHEIPVLDLV